MKNLELGVMPPTNDTRKFYFSCFSWMDKYHNAGNGFYKEWFKIMLFEKGFSDYVTTKTFSEEMMRGIANKLYSETIRRIEIDEELEALYNVV